MADNVQRVPGSGIQAAGQTPLDASQLATIRVMSSGGARVVAADTGAGALHRPMARGQTGSRISTLETLFDFFIDNVPDPDFALQNDPNFLARIRQQPDVHAAMRKREVSVASLPLVWKPSTEKGVDPAEAQLMCDYCADVWKGLPNMFELYRNMQSAVLHGGVGFEFVWQLSSENVARPVAWSMINKTRFVFDRLGNMSLLTREQPVWGAYVTVNPTKLFGEYQAFQCPPGRFMYHKYMAEGGTWMTPADEGYAYWGRGEDTNLYWVVKFDQFVLRFRLKWLEKHGMPFTVLYYPEGVVSQQQVNDVAKSIRDEAIATVPHPAGTPVDSWFQLDFIAPPPIGHDAFATFSREWTAPNVDKILLGGTEAMSIGDVGGYSATLNQREAGEAVLFRYDAMNIDASVCSQLVPHIVRAVPRWANVPIGHMPAHVMAPERPKNRMEELEILEKMATMVPVKEDDIYDAGGHQRPKDGQDGSEPERFVFLGQPAMGGDIFGALPPEAKGDNRGLADVESPRAEQTKQAKLFQGMKKTIQKATASMQNGQGGQNGQNNTLRRQRLNGAKLK